MSEPIRLSLDNPNPPLVQSKPYCSAWRISGIALGILLIGAALWVYFLCPLKQQVRAIVLGSVGGAGLLTTILSSTLCFPKQPKPTNAPGQVEEPPTENPLPPPAPLVKPEPKKKVVADPTVKPKPVVRDLAKVLSLRKVEILKKGKTNTALCGYDDVRASLTEDEQKVYDTRKKELLDTLKTGGGDLTEEHMRSQAALFGAVLGDVWGTQYEFLPYNATGNHRPIGETFHFVVNEKGALEMHGVPEANTRWKNEHPVGAGTYSDDSAQAVCLADALIHGRGELDQAGFVQSMVHWWEHGLNNGRQNKGSFGLGAQTAGTFAAFKASGVTSGEFQAKKDPKRKYDSGNGSVMRAAPGGIAARDVDHALEIGRKQSYASHSGEEAAECAAALTAIVHFIIHHKPKYRDDVIQFIEKELAPKIKVDSVRDLLLSKDHVLNPVSGQEENWDWQLDYLKAINYMRVAANPTYFGSYAMDALFLALGVWYKAGSYQEGLEMVVSAGGDADSIAAVYGQIAGAYYGIGGEKGIPAHWLDKVANAEKLAISAEQLHKLSGLEKEEPSVSPLENLLRKKLEVIASHRVKERVDRGAALRDPVIFRAEDANTSLCFYDSMRSVLDDEGQKAYDELQGHLADRLEKEPESFSEEEGKALATLTGLMLGDVLGLQLEFKSYKAKGESWLTDEFDIVEEDGKVAIKGLNVKGTWDVVPHGGYSDDTSQALVLADNLWLHNGLDGQQFGQGIKDWHMHGLNNGLGIPCFDIGAATAQGIKQYPKERDLHGDFKVTGDTKSNGNGTIMRAAPIAIAARSLEEAIEMGRKQSLVTHAGYEARECSAAFCGILYHLLYLGGKDDLDRFIQEKLAPQINQVSVRQLLLGEGKWKWRDKEFDLYPDKKPGLPGGYCMDALALALYSFKHSRDYKTCIKNAVERGGDSDTVGAIAGQLAGAFYGLPTSSGIPVNWIKCCKNYKKVVTAAYLLYHHNRKGRLCV
jgi:ADP-ribosyl-[dinitrogen reductase] hydrolase